MKLRKKNQLFIIAGIVALLTTIFVSIQLVFAHGSMANPVSRVYACYLEGPETPDSVACSDVIESSGTQPLYDWNEINIGNAGGNHQAFIPDGQLCSAGRAKYAAFDEPRTDWARTVMPDSGPYTFLYSAYVPHNQGYFELWVTKDGYDPTQPLKWSDIEQFAVLQRPPLVDGYYEMTVDLPAGKSGHHVIYSIWQRYDSMEAFYACSDVWFGAAPTPTPTTAPPCTAAAWNSTIPYSEGDVVAHNGAVWRARWGSSGVEPSGDAAPWRIREYCSSGGGVTPEPTTAPTDVPPTATAVPPTIEPTAIPPTATAQPPGGCTVTYDVLNQWNTGFTANVTIANNSSTTMNGWTLQFDFTENQTITHAWSSTTTQTGSSVTATNASWNGNISANGGTVNFGFNGSHTGSNPAPTNFTLNGQPCQ